MQVYVSMCIYLWTIANIFHANIYSNASYASNTCMFIARSVYMRAYFWQKPYINWLLDQWSHTKLSQKSWVVMKLSTWIHVQLRQKAWRICVILAKYPIKIPCAILNVILSKYLPHTLWIIMDLLCYLSDYCSHDSGCAILVFSDITQIARIMGPTWGLPGSCWPQVGPMHAPWTLLSGIYSGKPTVSLHDGNKLCNKKIARMRFSLWKRCLRHDRARCYYHIVSLNDQWIHRRQWLMCSKLVIIS